VILLVTHEQGGFDRCSQELAKRLKVEEYHCNRYFTPDEEKTFAKDLSHLEGWVHVTNQNFGRYCSSLRGPFIMTVHDLIRNFYDFDGESFEEKARLKLDEYFIGQATHLISVSETTKKEIITRLNIQEEKITVIYNGVNHDIYVPQREKTDVGHSYVLAVGSERPRKNLKRLVQAIARLRRAGEDLVLVKVGPIGRDFSFSKSWRAEADKLKVPLITAGEVSEKELARWYRGAAVLAFPSMMEGFGLPLLEAMACGCPVVGSYTPSIVEVVGDAGILVNPEEVWDITKGLWEALSRREELIEKGFQRAKTFSWDRAAEQTREVYRHVENYAGIEP